MDNRITFARSILIIRCRYFYPRRIRFLLVAMVLFFCKNLVSQNKTDSVSNKKSTGVYYQKMDTVISVRLNFNNEYDQFILSGDKQTYDIRPGVFVSNRLSVNYRFISLGAGFTLHFLPGNDGNEKQGKTRTFYLRTSLFLTHWFQELQYGKISGFYVRNTNDFIPDWDKDSDPYIQLPGLRVYMITGATSYKFNRNFSIKAIVTQTEIQRKSCGSFIPSLSYSFYRIDNTGEDQDPDMRQKTDTYNAVLNAGYYYTLVINRKYYASAGLTPGAGISYSHLTRYYQEGKVASNFFAPVYRLLERIGMGYNSRKFFAGADISLTQWIRYKKGGAFELNASRTYIQVFVGYRFRAPVFVKKNTKMIEDKIPILNNVSPETKEKDK